MARPLRDIAADLRDWAETKLCTHMPLRDIAVELEAMDALDNEVSLEFNYSTMTWILTLPHLEVRKYASNLLHAVNNDLGRAGYRQANDIYLDKDRNTLIFALEPVR